MMSHIELCIMGAILALESFIFGDILDFRFWPMGVHSKYNKVLVTTVSDCTRHIIGLIIIPISRYY